MAKRYKNWFWNSEFMVWFSKRVARFDAWLWKKMYGRKKN